MSFDFIFSIRATLSMSSQEKLLQDLAYLISGVVVLPLWTWLAVSTQQCLRVITSRTIPFSRRKIWLVKVFALVIPAGGVFGLASDLGAPLYFALFPALVIVIFGFREKVQGVIPPKPPQGEADYQIAWKEYRRLRKATMLSWMWSLGTFLLLILIPMVSVTLPKTAQIAFLTVSVLASMWMLFSWILGHAMDAQSLRLLWASAQRRYKWAHQCWIMIRTNLNRSAPLTCLCGATNLLQIFLLVSSKSDIERTAHEFQSSFHWQDPHH
jgi:hypothetical protein